MYYQPLAGLEVVVMKPFKASAIPLIALAVRASIGRLPRACPRVRKVGANGRPHRAGLSAHFHHRQRPAAASPRSAQGAVVLLHEVWQFALPVGGSDRQLPTP